MRNTILFIGFLILSTTFSSGSFSKPNYKSSNFNIEQIVSNIDEEIKERKSYRNFLKSIGFQESSNRYHIVNRYGYMGKYQFSKSLLKALGINTTTRKFLSTPSLQEEAMQRLINSNYKVLNKYITKYDNKYLHGYRITTSGMLAAAHLVGTGKVIKFIKHGTNSGDANGTKLTDYLEKFNGYEIEVR